MKWIIPVAALIIATAAHAGDTSAALRKRAPTGISETFFTCADHAGFDLGAYGACISVEKKLQDARLNKAYGRLMQKLPVNAKADLREAERAWLTYVNKSYDAEMAVHGMDKTVNVDAATHEMYRYCQRANELEDLLFFSGE